MNAMTLNSFPAFHSFTSPRSWFLALIVLLHVGFFWALSNGLSVGGVFHPPKKTILVLPAVTPKPAPPKPVVIDAADIEPIPVSRSEPRLPEIVVEDADPWLARGVEIPDGGDSVPAPALEIVTEPQIDARIGLSAPIYPSDAIRNNQSGTVLLSVYVLANGRVGEVRVEQSSGYRSLDEAAIREARRWRLLPGARDGAPTAMWKQIPVTFRLKDAVRF